LALALHAEQGSLGRAGLFLQTGEALGGSVGPLFQTAQLTFGVCDDRDSLVALARRGVQLTLRGLYLGLQVGKGFGGLGALLFQVGDILRCRARLFLQTGEALGGSVGPLFQTAQLAFGVCDDRDSLVALARRGVQLTLRGLYLGLQLGKGFGDLGALLFQVGDILRCRARLFLQTGEALGGSVPALAADSTWTSDTDTVFDGTYRHLLRAAKAKEREG
jgi:hypothetical protein